MAAGERRILRRAVAVDEPTIVQCFEGLPNVLGEENVAPGENLPHSLQALDRPLDHLMEEARGEQFDIREFHQLILENGMVPLSLLRQQVEDAL
jgi:hypothetical protein